MYNAVFPPLRTHCFGKKLECQHKVLSQLSVCTLVVLAYVNQLFGGKFEILSNQAGLQTCQSVLSLVSISQLGGVPCKNQSHILSIFSSSLQSVHDSGLVISSDYQANPKC